MQTEGGGELVYQAKPKVIIVKGEKWYNAAGVAELLGDLHITQAYALMRSGRIKATRKHDKVYRATHASVTEYKAYRKFWKGLHGQGPRAQMPALAG
jgi:hypothetical protein